MMKKRCRRILAAGLASVLAASSAVAVSAESSPAATLDEVVSALHNSDVQYNRLESMTGYVDYNVEKEHLSPNKDHDMQGTDGLPSQFDLRNVNGKNYVSPVKNQNPWPTCWSFASVAAAETSLAYAFDFDYNDKSAANADLFDLSERHLAWFMYTPLPEGNKRFPSQAGEGCYPLEDTSAMDNQQKSAAVLGIGGYMAQASTLLSAGIGPVLEKDIPYEGKDAELYNKTYFVYAYDTDSDGKIDPATAKFLLMGQAMSEEQFSAFVAQYEEMGYLYITMEEAQAALAQGNPAYANKTVFFSQAETGKGDWTVNEAYRFQSVFDYVEGNILANPAQSDENGAYRYDANATAMIKSELVNGRAVSVGIKADQSMPGQQVTTDSYLSYIDENGERATDIQHAPIWAHYSYDKVYDPQDPASVNHRVFDISHAVCIVGYDDNFPKEYFNDPKGTLQGNGAWLAKNSWGSIDAEDPANLGSWGSGYFWISYYDQSLSIPQSFRFAENKDNEDVMQNIDMYDFMPEINRDRVQFDNDVYMANVFTAKNNCTVRFIGIETVDADTTVEYSVYFLNDGATSPTDGYCAATAEVTFPFAGYHKIDLGRTMPMANGTRYSIVAKVVAGNKSAVYFNHAETMEGFIQYYQSRQARYVDSKSTAPISLDKLYSKGVVNAGESFIGVGGADGMQWKDWADVTGTLKSLNVAENIDFFTYDNFPIRSYPETELITAGNQVTDAKDSYLAGEKVEGLLIITNNTETDFADDTNFELKAAVGKENKEFSFAFTGLKAGETRTFPYTYTVTKADAKVHKVTSTMTILVNGKEYQYDPVFGDILSFTVKTQYSYVIGDANGDGIVNIMDVTAIQRNLADVSETFFDKKAADIDGNGVSITDATKIQSYLAEFGNAGRIGVSVRADEYELPFIPS